jgi:predicted ATP-dependent Lon-type protease
MFGNLFSQLGQFGQPRSRAQVIQRHNESLKYLTVTLKTMKHQYHVSKNRLVKPAERLGTPPAFSSCSPILCSELQLDVVHKGCVLSGTLIVDALMMTSVQTVLEDGAEDVVQVRHTP